VCNQTVTATQYALLSAFSAIGRVWVGPLAGTLTGFIGWPTFFIMSSFMAIPGLYILHSLKDVIIQLEKPASASH
jgi:PAT family beta-lactamase induction signal transducer AmpG